MFGDARPKPFHLGHFGGVDIGDGEADEFAVGVAQHRARFFVDIENAASVLHID